MQKKLIFLLIKFCLVYLSWYLLFHFLSDTKAWTEITNAIRSEVIFFSKYSLIFIGKFLNFSVDTITTSISRGTVHDSLIFYSKGKTYQNFGTLGVEFGCLAVNLMYFYAGFILIFFGSWKQKLWYIPLGILIINTINIIRLIGLGLTIIYYPEYLSFNHHFLFTLITYLIIIILCLIWIIKYAGDDILKFFTELKDKKNAE